MPLRLFMYGLPAVALAVAYLPSPGPVDAITGRASVVDGDTIEIHGTRIRLHGIDAPESAQTCRRADGTRWRCGQQTALALDDLVEGRPVTCRIVDTDRYGRFIGRCTVAGFDISGWLVEHGWAVAYERYSTDYVEQQQVARSRAVGVWSGEFDMPWDWRNSETTVATRTGAPGACRIKGNIGSGGERIYHVPGQPFYDRTRIDPSRGERWFCTEEEARAAGWRKAQ